MAAANDPRMPPRTTDLATVLDFLKEGVDQIMTKGRADISLPRYSSLCTTLYNYITSGNFKNDRGPPESDGIEGRKTPLYVNMGTERTKRPSDFNEKVSAPYLLLVRYFARHSAGILDKADALRDEALLRYYAEEWDRYVDGAGCVGRVFSHLNRFYVNPARCKGQKGVYPVSILALVQWKENLFLPLQQKQMSLTSAVLKLIEAERNGAIIDQGLVKKVLDSFISLDLDDSDLNKTCLDIYEKQFEVPFLDATQKFYKQESESFLAANRLSDYLKEVEERLQEEEDRADAYLNPRTREALISKCRGLLICEHTGEMWERSQSLRTIEDLQRMFSLLSLIPKGEEPLRKEFKGVVPERAGESVQTADTTPT